MRKILITVAAAGVLGVATIATGTLAFARGGGGGGPAACAGFLAANADRQWPDPPDAAAAAADAQLPAPSIQDLGVSTSRPAPATRRDRRGAPRRPSASSDRNDCRT
jgi:hypothetical protein